MKYSAISESDLRTRGRVFGMTALVLAVVLAVLVCVGSTQAATIIKVDFGDDLAPDIEFDGSTLSTVDDSVGLTPGEQNTGALFLDILSSIGDIPTPDGSITIDGLVTGTLTIVPIGTGVVIQEFLGGMFEVYDDALGTAHGTPYGLLLSGTLTDSLLTGAIGNTTGSVFTTSLGTYTGGSLLSLLDPDSLQISMSFTDISLGAGLSVSGAVGFETLGPFTSDVTGNFEGLIPEPASIILLMLGCVGFGLTSRGRR